MVMEAYAVTDEAQPAMMRPPDASREGPAHREAFSAMIRTHDRGMRTLAYRLLEDVGAMDDVLQEAYLKAYRAYGTFRHESSVATWLYRIVYNCCMDHLRRAGRDHLRSAASIEQLSETGFDVPSPDLPDALDWREEIKSALGTLPAEQRAAVVLVDGLGYDHRSAAGILGVRRATVATRLHRARSVLRRTLSANMREETR